MPEKNPKVKLGLKKFAMLPSYFDYIFVHLRQILRLRPNLSPKFLSSLDPNLSPTPKAPPDLPLCFIFPLIFYLSIMYKRVVQKTSFFFKFYPSLPQIVRLVIDVPYTKFQLIWFTGKGEHAI